MLKPKTVIHDYPLTTIYVAIAATLNTTLFLLVKFV
jgi:hypothetical protein